MKPALKIASHITMTLSVLIVGTGGILKVVRPKPASLVKDGFGAYIRYLGITEVLLITLFRHS